MLSRVSGVFFHAVEGDLTQRCQFQSFMLFMPTVAKRCLTNLRLIGNSPEPKRSISEGGKGGEKKLGHIHDCLSCWWILILQGLWHSFFILFFCFGFSVLKAFLLAYLAVINFVCLKCQPKS